MKRMFSITSIAVVGLAFQANAGAGADLLSSLQKQLERTHPQTIQRPLFRADRRPEKQEPVLKAPVAVQEVEEVETPVVQAAAYVPPPAKLLISTYALKGVILNGDQSIAFLEHTTTKKMLRLGRGIHDAPGENGDIKLTVEKIDAQSVTLTADQSVTLSLRKPGEGVETMVAEAPADPTTTANAETIVQASSETTIAPLTPKGTNRLRRFAIVASE